MEILRYTPELKTQWNEFLSQAINGVFLFDRDYMDYHNDRFFDHSLIVVDNERWVALIPASSSNKEWCSHAGLSYGGLVVGKKMSQTKMLRCLSFCLKALSADGIRRVTIKLMPDIYSVIRQQSLSYALFHQGFELFRRDAATSIFLCERQKMSKGRSASIKRAVRLGVVVSQSSDFKSFMVLENENLEKKYGVTAVHTDKELNFLAARFPKNIKLYNATFEGQLVAGGVVYQSGQVMHLQYMATNDEGAEAGAGDLVIHTMLQDCENNGIGIFDFGISTENDGKDLNKGLNKYKESFGGITTVADFYRLNLSEKMLYE